jgi:isocitrate/isopropylmalate dehydrogenase
MTGTPLRVAVIRGDGIGPELIDSAVAVLQAVTAGSGVELMFGEEDGGAEAYRRTGAALAPETLARLRSDYDAILKGPVGLPNVRKPDGTEGGLLGGILRAGLDTFANVRPVRLLPGARTPTTFAPEQIDYVIVRENTEGLYLARGSGVGNDRAVADTLLMTRHGVGRVVRFAFELARNRSGAPADGVRRVTCVDKSNVLRSYAFFRAVFDQVALEYPDVEADHRYSDAAAHDLVMTPARFDVLVMENFLGDLLSDVGAATVGGLGMCGSGNIGTDHAYFEAIHGSAPTMAGRDVANPTSQILSAAMLLDHLGHPDLAHRINRAVTESYADGAIRIDEFGRVNSTTQASAAVIERL